MGRFLVVAPPKTGKSLLVMQLAHCLALGADFLGFGVSGKLRVHYIDGEMGPFMVQNRLFQMAGAYPEAAKNIFFTMFPTDGVEAAMRTVPDVDLFVIDPAISLGYDDENSSATVRRMLDTIHKVAMEEYGAAIVLVHHTRKGSPGTTLQEARGSGSFVDWVDGGMLLRREDGGDYSATFITRGAETPEPIKLTRDLETLVYSTGEGFGDVVLKCTLQWQMEYNTAHEPPVEELVKLLMAELGQSRSTVYRKLKKFRGLTPAPIHGIM